MTKTDIKHRRCIALMVVLLIFGVLLSFRIGRYPVPLQELLGILGSKLGLVGEAFWTKQMESAGQEYCLVFWWEHAFPPPALHIRVYFKIQWPHPIFWAPLPVRASVRRWLYS